MWLGVWGVVNYGQMGGHYGHFFDGGLIILSNDTKYTTAMHVQSCPTHPPRLGINFVDLTHVCVHFVSGVSMFVLSLTIKSWK